jgi:hypothetical protein
MPEFDCGKNLVTGDLVKTLRGRRQRFEVMVIERSHGDAIQYLPIGIIQDKVHGISLLAIW